jgi:hypothetical protein
MYSRYLSVPTGSAFDLQIGIFITFFSLILTQESFDHSVVSSDETLLSSLRDRNHTQ